MTASPRLQRLGAPIASAIVTAAVFTGAPLAPRRAVLAELLSAVLPIFLQQPLRLTERVAAKWLARPDAKVVRSDRAGHFLQEEVPDLLADALLSIAT